MPDEFGTSLRAASHQNSQQQHLSSPTSAQQHLQVSTRSETNSKQRSPMPSPAPQHITFAQHSLELHQSGSIMRSPNGPLQEHNPQAGGRPVMSSILTRRFGSISASGPKQQSGKMDVLGSVSLLVGGSGSSAALRDTANAMEEQRVVDELETEIHFLEEALQQALRLLGMEDEGWE